MSITAPSADDKLKQLLPRRIWETVNIYTHNWAPHLLFGLCAHFTFATVFFRRRRIQQRVPELSHLDIACVFTTSMTLGSFTLCESIKCIIKIKRDQDLIEVRRLAEQYNRKVNFRFPLSWDERYFQPFAFGQKTFPDGIVSATERMFSRILASQSTREVIFTLLYLELSKGRLSMHDFDVCVTYLSNLADREVFQTARGISAAILVGMLLGAMGASNPIFHVVYGFQLLSLIQRYHQCRLPTTFENPKEVCSVLRDLDAKRSKLLDS